MFDNQNEKEEENKVCSNNPQKDITKGDLLSGSNKNNLTNINKIDSIKGISSNRRSLNNSHDPEKDKNI